MCGDQAWSDSRQGMMILVKLMHSQVSCCLFSIPISEQPHCSHPLAFMRDWSAGVMQT